MPSKRSGRQGSSPAAAKGKSESREHSPDHRRLRALARELLHVAAGSGVPGALGAPCTVCRGRPRHLSAELLELLAALPIERRAR